MKPVFQIIQNSIEKVVPGKTRRIAAYRCKQSGQLDICHNNGYRYYAIVTSDTGHSPLDVLKYTTGGAAMVSTILKTGLRFQLEQAAF